MTTRPRPTVCHLNDGSCGILQTDVAGNLEILRNSLGGTIIEVQGVRRVLFGTGVDDILVSGALAMTNIDT